jgi:hypothetical protein
MSQDEYCCYRESAQKVLEDKAKRIRQQALAVEAIRKYMDWDALTKEEEEAVWVWVVQRPI